MTILEEKALQYCNDVVSGKEITTPEVVLQCKRTLEELELQKNEDYPYFMDGEFLEVVEKFLHIINFATGLNDVVDKPVIQGLHNFQAYFFYSIFGWKYKDNPKKYRWRDITLFIARKNAKSWLAAMCLIIYMLTEPKYTEFYSICTDRDLAAEIKKAMTQIIEASPALHKYFTIPKTTKGKVVCKITDSFYQARTADSGRNNAIRASVFINDECASFVKKDNINAMRSGQKSVLNAIQINTTTAYAVDNSIMFDEIDYIKKVLNGKIENDRLFALLYYATEEHLWDDTGLQMANPLRIEENYNEIRENRELAKELPKNREEYLTKEMNHFIPAQSGEAYIDVDLVRKCKIEEFDWNGKEVYVGLDLAMTNDNVSFSMATYDRDEDKIYADSFAIIPKGRIQIKNQLERINYNNYIMQGKCYACGDLIVDYGFIEERLLEIEQRFGCKVMGFGFDRYNALSTVSKIEKEGYECIEIKQHSTILHGSIKLLEEYIKQQKFHYIENDLLEINFANARCTYDTNLNRYLNKKKSNGKIDMVVSLIMAIYLIEQNNILNQNDFVCQVI